MDGITHITTEAITTHITTEGITTDIALTGTTIGTGTGSSASMGVQGIIAIGKRGHWGTALITLYGGTSRTGELARNYFSGPGERRSSTVKWRASRSCRKRGETTPLIATMCAEPGLPCAWITPANRSAVAVHAP